MNSEEETKKLIQELEELERNIDQKKESIKKLQVVSSTPKVMSIETQRLEEQEDDEIIEDNFLEEFNFFLENYRMLRENFEPEEFLYVLPSKKHKDYKNIILRLYLESKKEIHELLMMKDSTTDEEEKEEIDRLIEHEKRKCELLKERLYKKEVETDLEEEKDLNEIILVPTISGNIRVLEEIEHIKDEYYEGFKELIDSIVDGTFKNVKVFTNDRYLVGISEVKLFKIRVVFTRLSSNKYALITAFTKKSDNDKLYGESLRSKVFDYRKMEKRIKELIEDEEFLKLNGQYVEELYNVLNKKEKDKQLRKED